MTDFFKDVWDAIYAAPESVKGGVAAFFVAHIRSAYDNKEPQWSRRMLEAMLCGLLVVCTTSVVSYFFPSIPSGIGQCFGGIIGFLGVDKFRAYLDNRLEIKFK